MRTIEELKQLYEQTLVHDLKPLEQRRKKALASVLLAALPGAVSILIATKVMHPVFMLIIPIASLIATIIVFFTIVAEYKHAFKSSIIEKIVKFAEPAASYEPAGYIPQPLYMSSGIFTVHPDRYSGEDKVSAKVGATQLNFSELHTQYKTEYTDSKGHRRTQWHTIFKGLFLVADFNKSFHGKTVVLPDTAEKLFGKFGQMLQSMNIMRGQLIKLEDPEFEKLFAVYGDDQVEARYILSTSLMKRISDFKTKSKKQIYLSFRNNNIFVAIWYSKGIFEPKLLGTIMDFDPIREYFEDIRLALGVVEDLNLNTRIWGK